MSFKKTCLALLPALFTGCTSISYRAPAADNDVYLFCEITQSAKDPAEQYDHLSSASIAYTRLPDRHYDGVLMIVDDKYVAEAREGDRGTILVTFKEKKTGQVLYRSHRLGNMRVVGTSATTFFDNPGKGPGVQCGAAREAALRHHLESWQAHQAQTPSPYFTLKIEAK